jgi:predicted nucleic acid-binding protein
VTPVVVDSSVLAAVCFVEPDADAWALRLDGAALHAPRLLRYELQSVARKKCRAHPELAREVIEALALALDERQGITWIDPDPVDVVLLARATGLTTYDATYLCLAGMLEADLVTRDAALAAAVDPRTHDVSA